jgi:hypothetical protein
MNRHVFISYRRLDEYSAVEKAKAAVAAEGPNVMGVWGTPQECIEKIKFYVDAMHPEQLMLNIASGSLAQDKVLKSMRLCAEEVMPVVRLL